MAKSSSKFDYKKTSFVLYDGVKIVKACRVRNDDQYRELLEYAKNKHYGLKRGTIEERNGKLVTCGPFVFDWDSLAEDDSPSQPEKTSRKPKKSDADDILEKVFTELEEARQKDESINAHDIKAMVLPTITSMSAFTIRMKNFLEKKKENRIMERAGSKNYPVYKLKKIDDSKP